MQNFRITWNEDVVRPFSAGVDRGMFYIPEAAGIPWNGLQEVVESSPDSVMSQLYQDGEKLFVRRRNLNYESQIRAFTYPPEFEPYSGYRPGFLAPFNFSYRVMTGEETYCLHLVYNVVAIPDDLVFSTLGDELDPTIFGWKFTTRPVRMAGKAASSHIIIDSATVHSWTLAALEDQMYGGENIIPHMPPTSEIEQIFEDNAILKVVDNGDGTVTITGPDEAIQALTNQRTQLTWPSVIKLSTYEYQVSSL